MCVVSKLLEGLGAQAPPGMYTTGLIGSSGAYIYYVSSKLMFSVLIAAILTYEYATNFSLTSSDEQVG